jgi:hypothetical protein
MTDILGEKVVSVREVVAVFSDAKTLDDAIESLEIAGSDRAAISVMSSQDTIDSKLGHLFRKSAQSADADDVARGVEVSRYDLAEGIGAVVSIPVFIGVTAGLIAVFSIGGGVIAAIIAGLGAATLGGGFGAAAALVIGKHHADHLEEQLQQGGLLLWVRVSGAADEKAKLDLLRSVGGKHVHGHLYQGEWGINEVPLHDAHPDPLLINE